MTSDDLVPTADAAKAIGVSRRSLVRWWNEGKVTPDVITPGGHGRWSVERLKQQLREQSLTDDE